MLHGGFMSPQGNDHAEIRELIADWSAAVRRKDYDGVLRNHSRNMLMFDVPPPFQSEGIDAYRKDLGPVFPLDGQYAEVRAF
jgi:ketosteroid isomerase-like protein